MYPPAGVSLARGFAAVGGSPTILILTFLAGLGIWLLYSSYGSIIAPSPTAMVLLESLPPMHSFLDIDLLARGRVVSAPIAIGYGAGLLLARGVLLGLGLSLIIERLEGGASIRRALTRARRTFSAILVVEAGFLSLEVASFLVASGFLGPLGIIAALVGGIYFFIYAPVAVVAEGMGVREAARASARAARIPGPRHTMLIVGYFSATLLLFTSTPGSRVAEATPSFLVWAFALFIGFLHMGVLAAFTYRWFAVRSFVLPPPEATRLARPPARRASAR